MGEEKKGPYRSNLKLLDISVNENGERQGILDALNSGIRTVKEKDIKRGIIILVDDDFKPDTYFTSGISNLGVVAISEICKLVFMDRHMMADEDEE